MIITGADLYVFIGLIVTIIFIAIISSYGWLTEYTKRKESERKNKETFETEMALLRSYNVVDHGYNHYLKDIEKSIIKERSKDNVFMR